MHVSVHAGTVALDDFRIGAILPVGDHTLGNRVAATFGVDSKRDIEIAQEWKKNVLNFLPLAPEISRVNLLFACLEYSSINDAIYFLL